MSADAQRDSPSRRKAAGGRARTPAGPPAADLAAKQAAIRAKLASLWKDSIPVIEQRLALLDDAIAAARSGTLTAEQNSDAAGEAHKLAGSLGMFGYTEAGSLAREIEVLFEGSPAPDGAALEALAERLRGALPLS